MKVDSTLEAILKYCMDSEKLERKILYNSMDLQKESDQKYVTKDKMN